MKAEREGLIIMVKGKKLTEELRKSAQTFHIQAVSMCFGE